MSGFKIRVLDGPGGTVSKREVPDGKWLAQVSLSRTFHKSGDKQLPESGHVRWVRLIGVEQSEVECVLCTHAPFRVNDLNNGDVQRWWVIADKPFVVISHVSDPAKPYLQHHRKTHATRQIHKGELGRSPVLERKPMVVRSGFYDPDHDHGGSVSWVRLHELGKIVGMDEVELLRGFAGFSPSTHYLPNVPILMAEHPADVSAVHTVALQQERLAEESGRRLGGAAQMYRNRVYPVGLPNDCCVGEAFWSISAITLEEYQEAFMGKTELDGRDAFANRIWVPQSWAFKVLRLIQFGYHPNNEAPEPSFEFKLD